MVTVSGVTEGAELTVFDALGRQVWRTTLAADAVQVRIDLGANEYANGMYQISLRTANGLVTKSLVVKKR
jgi:hypothetical protein